MNIATKPVNVVQETATLLEKLGVSKSLYTGGDMASFSPVTGEQIASLKTVSATEAAAKIEKRRRCIPCLAACPGAQARRTRSAFSAKNCARP